MRKHWKVSGLIFLMLTTIVVLGVGCIKNTVPATNTVITPPPIETKPTDKETTTSSLSEGFVFPIEQGKNRVTKKTFGLKVSPKNSPVSPEKFSGYHTGVDFEILKGEVDKEIIIKAICSGPLLMKKWATGYGGVAVQKCELNKEVVTVVYGHLKLDSISASINTELKAGDQLGILGKGYSPETDNERKHLHLSIHSGASINIRGYSSTQGELDKWLNPIAYLK